MTDEEARAVGGEPMPDGRIRFTMLTGAICARCGATLPESQRALWPATHGIGRCAKVATIRIYDGGKDITPEGLWAP